MICEICGTVYRKIDTMLVCSQGHTLENTIEVAVDDHNFPIAMKSKKIRTKKKEKVSYMRDKCSLMKMILLKLLFEEAKDFFCFSNDNVFKYFTGFFEVKKGQLETGLKVAYFIHINLYSQESTGRKERRDIFYGRL